MSVRLLSRSAALAALVVGAAMAGPAQAHVGLGDGHDLAHGFAHPLGGLDHVLAMVAVGLFAAHLGGRALWLVPAAFMGMMAAGAALGMAGVAVPMVETGIGLSVLVFGLAVALRWTLPAGLAVALVGVFAVFHGHAHGAELPETAGGLAFAAGFLGATALLHLAGLSLGAIIARLGETGGLRAARVAGLFLSAAGVALLAGVV